MTARMGQSGGTAARITKRALSSALLAAWKVARSALPASLLVAALRWTGVLGTLSSWLAPGMRFLGLPGEAALVLAGSAVAGLYAAIPLVHGLGIGGRALSILAVMCLTARNLPAETVLMKRTGSSALKMIFLRLAFAAAAGFACNALLPYSEAEAAACAAAAETATGEEAAIAFPGAAEALEAAEAVPPESATAVPAAPSTRNGRPPLVGALGDWARDASLTLLEMIAIVALVAVLQKVLDELGFMRALSTGLAPALRAFGLPRGTDALWIVIQAMGYRFGAKTLRARIDAGEIAARDGDLLNHHAALCHSLLEDTVLFAAFGAPVLLITLPRIGMAALVTWLERARRYLFRKSFQVGTV